MAKYTIITRKIEVHLHKQPDEEDLYKQHWEIWRNINDKLYEAANCIVSHCFFNDEYEHRLRIQSAVYRDIEKSLRNSKKNKLSDSEIKELKDKQSALNKEFSKRKKDFLKGGAQTDSNPEQNSTYRVASEGFRDYIPTEILTCLNQNIISTYNTYKLAISRGERSIPTYKKGYPVPFSIKLDGKLRLQRRENGDIYVSFPKGLEWDLSFGRDRSNNREIVERVLSGMYDVGNSTIQETKNRKIFLLLVVKIPQKSVTLAPERVVGIDLGINTPVCVALNDNDYGGLSIGSRDSFHKVRTRFNAKKRELQRDLRYSTNGGRGRTHKLQALERLNAKERNWVHLQNHIFSKSVVEYAQKMRAGVIQMEDLSNFGKTDQEVEDGYKYVLRYWSYFELQQVIQYKASAAGITVRFVNPYHTSQTCSFCGHYEKGQRISQSTFICKNPGCTKGKGHKCSDGSFDGINADWNATRNIAKSRDYTK